MTRRAIMFQLLCLCACVATVPTIFAQPLAEKPCEIVAGTSTAQRLLHIHECGGIGAQRSRPWHARIEMTIFDETGKNPQSAVIEYAQSAQNDRLTYTVGGASFVEMHTADGTYDNRSQVAMPYGVRRLIEDFLDPGPVEANINATQPEVRPLKVGNIPLDCVMLGLPLKPDGPYTTHVPTPLGLFPTYCVTVGTAELRLTTESGSVQVLRSVTGTFLGRSVAVQQQYLERGVVRARSKVVMLSTFTPDAHLFALDGLVEDEPSLTKLSSGVIAGSILKKVPPSYPVGARDRHATGSVVMHAIIGADGHVQRLTPVSFPDIELVEAAMTAVLQWTYRPYLLNGRPTSVDTTITVNFNMS